MTEEQSETESAINLLLKMPDSWLFKDEIDSLIENYRTLQQQNKQLIDWIKRAMENLKVNAPVAAEINLQRALQQIQGNK